MILKKRITIILTSILLTASINGFANPSASMIPKPLTQIPSPNKYKTLPKPNRSTIKLNGIAAYVNNDIITIQELNRALHRTKKMIAASGQLAPSESVLRKQVLMQLVYQKLQLQMAKRAGITVNNQQINTAIHNLAKQHNMSVKQLKKQLYKQGYNPKNFRNEMKKEIIISKLQQQSIGKSVVISDQDVANFYKQYLQKQESQIQYKVADLLIPISDSNSAKQLKSGALKTQAILKKLKHGQHFQTIAREDSDVSFNNLGWRSGNELPQLFLKQLQQMKVGSISRPILAPNGYHILKLIKKHGKAGALPSKERIQRVLYQQKFQKALEKWLKGLRKKAYVKIISQ